ncbi:prepilin peptidase [Paraburkholderia phymatum]|uniref:Peptidase A24A prepilin type IV n=1 Tax=Paraburkholderia phymatum (strain DSM 17167 / CIP 108236 / LMG 21445 / STM815) TaxID=391038 RepID=B2JN03_PARP8|nr:prepilin peptidase [Paraburkholderia phymatum]ACC74396.1 peptidase A24A prepilin type IV [Paraburkholderia phymatum STM815]
MNGVPFPVGPCVLALVAIAAIYDLHARRIPNWLVVIGLGVGLAVQAALHGMASGMSLWVVGALTGGAMLMPGYLLRMLGAGDVKLMAAVGCFCGGAGAFQAALAVCAVGGVWALVELLRHGQMRAGLQNMTAALTDVWMPSGGTPHAGSTRTRRPTAGSLPYGVAIAVGTMLALFASV